MHEHTLRNVETAAHGHLASVLVLTWPFGVALALLLALTWRCWCCRVHGVTWPFNVVSSGPFPMCGVETWSWEFDLQSGHQ